MDCLAGPCPASAAPLVSVSAPAVACSFPCLSCHPCLPCLLLLGIIFPPPPSAPVFKRTDTCHWLSARRELLPCELSSAARTKATIIPPRTGIGCSAIFGLPCRPTTVQPIA